MQSISASGSLLLVFAVAPATGVLAQEDSTARTVMGPSNLALYEGSEALRRGDGETGVRLTLQGLEVAGSFRERQAALSNLCAGYILLENYEAALENCNKAIAENERNWRALSNRALVYLRLGRYAEARADVARGQELAPNARNLKEVKGLLLDQTHPVEPTIVIDDRRETDDDES